MKNTNTLVGPVVAGVLAWFLSGSWELGVSLFVAFLVNDKIREYYSK